MAAATQERIPMNSAASVGAVTAARDVHARLIARHAELDSEFMRLGKERGALTLEAFTGNADALRRIDQIRSECARIEADQADIAAAIEAAAHKITEAEGVEAQAGRALRAETVIRLLPEIEECGNALGDALDRLVNGLRQFEALIAEASRFGAPLPRSALVRTSSRRCVESALGAVGLADRVAPSDQRDFPGYTAILVSGARDWVGRELGEAETQL